jgi:hypothetical protein
LVEVGVAQLGVLLIGISQLGVLLVDIRTLVVIERLGRWGTSGGLSA